MLELFIYGDAMSRGSDDIYDEGNEEFVGGGYVRKKGDLCDLVRDIFC